MSLDNHKFSYKFAERILNLIGSPTWARTRDLRINSPSLYRLSYQGMILDAQGGIEPPSGAYETPELPLLYRAAIYMAPRRGFDPLASTVTVSRSPN